jgi:hypothetical protein
LGYFLWKRQWKMAAATTAATLVFTMLPAWWMGSTRYTEAMTLWSTYASRGLTEQNPTTGVLGRDTVQNLSLRPALAAIVPTSAAPVAAGFAIKVVLVTLALAVAWRFRRRVENRTSPVVLWECAIVSLAMLLYSPITWTQHCVGILPAMVLLLLSAPLPRRVPNLCWWAVGGYVLAILVLNRAFLGREWSLALLAIHVPAWSLLALFFVALACHQRAVASNLGDALENFGEPCTLPRQLPLGA